MKAAAAAAARRHSAWTARVVSTMGMGGGKRAAGAGSTSGTTTKKEQQEDRFFVNQETGETSWARPADYESPEEEERLDDAEVAMFELGTPREGLRETFARVAEPRDGVEEDGDDAAKRADQLRLMIKYIGEDEDWVELAKDANVLFRVAKSCWASSGATRESRLAACRVLANLATLDEELLDQLDASAALDGVITQSVALGLTSDEPELVGVRAYGAFLLAWLRRRHVTGFPSPGGALPSESALAKALVESLTTRLAAASAAGDPDELVDLLASVLMALVWHVTGGQAAFTEVNPDLASRVDVSVVAEQLAATLPPPQAQRSVDGSIFASSEGARVVGDVVLPNGAALRVWCDSLMRTLNAQRFPYEDDVSLSQSSRAWRWLLGLSASDASKLPSSDLRVLQEQCVDEVRNLPPENPHRLTYLCLLHAVVSRPDWGYHQASQAERAVEELIVGESQVPGSLKALAAEVLDVVQRAPPL